jgi:metal-responsive CopG/Arc/MetJ family transcriptional regulator
MSPEKRGRPAIGVRVPVRIPADDLAEIDRLARAADMTRAEMVRGLLRASINQHLPRERFETTESTITPDEIKAIMAERGWTPTTDEEQTAHLNDFRVYVQQQKQFVELAEAVIENGEWIR